MRFVAYVVAILTLAACGSSSAAARPSPSQAVSPSGAVTPGGTPSASPASPSASPSATPSPVAGGYAVLATPITADSYTVSLIGIDGSVVASASSSAPLQITCADGTAANLPLPVSTSQTRAYFLDAQGNVRFLTPNGETGIATRVPSGGNIRSMFAVSPDDQRIAVVKDTFTSSGATTVLYVENLVGAGNHLQIFSESGATTLWPTGWHGSTLIVGKAPSCSSGRGPTCCWPQEYHVVNPATGARLDTVGGPNCIPIGDPSPAGATCEDPTFSKATILDWSGAARKTLAVQGLTPAYLSPDGSEVALVVNGQTTFAGAKQTLDLVACGWIDGTHVIAGGDSESQPRVGDVTSGNIAPVAALGVCAGRIPGGL